MEDWKIFITTFNCAKKFPQNDETWISRIVKELISPVIEAQDMFVFGFQEFVPIWEGSFKETVNEYLDFVCEVMLKELNFKLGGVNYRLLACNNMGAIALLILVRDDIVNTGHISYVECSRGILGTNLKGGVAISFDLMNPAFHIAGEKETFTFVCNHLNANEGDDNALARIEDLNGILNKCENDLRMNNFKNGHIFVFGDLNFRMKKLDCDITQLEYTNPVIISDLAKNNDELNIYKDVSKFLLQGFEEPKINFPPTYKYEVGSSNNYNYKRIPSWCDRILFKKYVNTNLVNILNYNTIARSDCLQFSDHQAVSMILTVSKNANCTQLISVPPNNISSQYYEILGAVSNVSIGYLGWIMSYKYAYPTFGFLILIWIIRLGLY